MIQSIKQVSLEQKQLTNKVFGYCRANKKQGNMDQDNKGFYSSSAFSLMLIIFCKNNNNNRTLFQKLHKIIKQVICLLANKLNIAESQTIHITFSIFSVLKLYYTLIKNQNQLYYQMISDQLKKDGFDDLQEEETITLNLQNNQLIGGIPKKYIISSKLELVSELLCPLCNKIIWKPVACSQSGCFSNFCQYCIEHWNCRQDNIVLEEGQQLLRLCPKCSKPFKKTNIPLLNTLLSSLVIKCVHHNNGCNEYISYQSYLKHALKCEYCKVECEGCKKLFMQKDLKLHKDSCQYIKTKCQKCLIELPQLQFASQHNSIKCLQVQLTRKNKVIQKLQGDIEEMKGKLDYYQMTMQKVLRGQYFQLPIQFHTSFPMNFNFLRNQVKLIKASWNANKQKYDFLHFYITYTIKTQAVVGTQWKLHIKTLQGNLLIGVCSSLAPDSLDYVINKFGEIKKKQSNQHKYKLIRKTNLTFSESDIISFKYQASRRVLRIQNQTKGVQCKFDSKQIGQIGQNLYTFYSLDICGDTIKFL